MIQTRTDKDGNGTVTYTWEVDETKPKKFQVEGMFYQFNSKLIDVKYDKITEKENDYRARSKTVERSI